MFLKNFRRAVVSRSRGTFRHLHPARKSQARGTIPDMAKPTGFEYVMRGEDVVITHHGATAGVLRGAKAADFLAEVEHGDAQLLMAKLTGNYRHGNERMARQHPRNQR